MGQLTLFALVVRLALVARIISSPHGAAVLASLRSSAPHIACTMFTVLDTAAGVPKGRLKSAADRACDQCKARKVRCDMSNPCERCVSKNLGCTYNEGRKRRGPVGRRVSKMQKLQYGADEGILQWPIPTTSPASDVPSTTNLPQQRSTGVMTTSDHSAAHSPWPSTEESTITASLGKSSDQAFVSLLPGDRSYTAPPRSIPSPQQDDCLLPSLPVDAPSENFDLFASISLQDPLPIAGGPKFWPWGISQEAMLPWMDVYFERLHPTVPVLNRTMVYQEMLLHRHHHDPQFGAMLLSLCAFAMTQPVQIHEIESAPSRSAQARILLEASVKMRTTVDFGETPSLHMVLTSFFLFACLFGSGLHKAAHHRLREAVDLATSLSMHLPQAYDDLDPETREQWLRTYFVLSVTER